MLGFQKILDDLLGELPYQYLGRKIETKLAHEGISASSPAVREAAKQIIVGDSNTFQLEDDVGVVHQIEMSECELNEVLKELEDFSERKLAKFVRGTSSDASDHLYKSLVERWPQQHTTERERTKYFNEVIEKRWGKALDKLRMLYTICREWGQDVNERKRKAKNGEMTHLDDVMLRLHVRACQVYSEILVLLENGLGRRCHGAVAHPSRSYDCGHVHQEVR